MAQQHIQEKRTILENNSFYIDLHFMLFKLLKVRVVDLPLFKTFARTRPK